MKPSTSRLLTRLDTDIAAERDPFRADCLRAERAAYLARQGRLDDARTELAGLHQRHDARPRAEMSAWMSLVESLLSYFSDMGPVALDKMRRSRALSEAAGFTQLQALGAAWLAQMDYNRHDIPALSKSLGQALSLADREHHSARSRACLVIGMSYHLAERFDLAMPWYRQAHDHATAEGDDASISALMHNMAWIRSANLCKASLTGSDDHGEGQHAMLAAESTWAFDRLVGATSLDTFVPLLHAQILAVRGSVAFALELYELHLEASLAQGLERLHGSLLADQAWCRVKLGQFDLARDDAIRAEGYLEPDGHFHDRAPGYSRLSQVFAMLGDNPRAERNAAIASRLWLGHAAFQQKLIVALLATVGDAPPSTPAP